MHKSKKLAVACLVGLASLVIPNRYGSTAFASRVVVGGIYEATDLIDPTNSTDFRAFPNTGLYIHNGGTISGVNYGWLSLTPTQKEQMVSVWQANGPQSLELGWEADGLAGRTHIRQIICPRVSSPAK